MPEPFVRRPRGIPRGLVFFVPRFEAVLPRGEGKLLASRRGIFNFSEKSLVARGPRLPRGTPARSPSKKAAAAVGSCCLPECNQPWISVTGKAFSPEVRSRDTLLHAPLTRACASVDRRADTDTLSLFQPPPPCSPRFRELVTCT